MAAAGLFSGGEILVEVFDQILRGFLGGIQVGGRSSRLLSLRRYLAVDLGHRDRTLAFEIGVGILLLPLLQKLQLFLRILFLLDRLGEVVLPLILHCRRFGRGSLRERPCNEQTHRYDPR